MSALNAEWWRSRLPAPRSRGWWVIWFTILLVATTGMLPIREHLDKAHVALAFLLIVLGASAAGGRALGIAIAGVAFLSFNWFFLPPYGTLIIANPLDWLVLFAFLVTSVVAAQLLYRATSTAEAATERAAEVDRLAALGAETLNAAGADEALQAIVEVIRTALDMDECDVFTADASGRLVRAATATRAPMPRATGDQSAAMPAQDHSLAEWIVEHGRSAVELADGTIRLAPLVRSASGPLGAVTPDVSLHRAVAHVVGESIESRTNGAQGRERDSADDASGRSFARALAIPLSVRDHTVGVLRMTAARGIVLAPEQIRLLTALAYYAALGVERLRLVATAERAESERRVERLRSALLTAVSHDLRTPLTTIKGIAHEIAGGADPQRASVIEAEADRLDALVADFLDLSRIHAGAVPTNPAVNTVDDVIGAALQRAAGILRGRVVEVEEESEELLMGRFDFSQSLRILVNLLDNAAKYSPAGTTVTVRAARKGDRLTISVLDRGAGVARGEREHIFEPFYRPAGVSPDVRGTGLGLSIARGLAEAQGGALGYEDRAGGGSVFTLELPGADPPPAETRLDHDDAE